MVYLQWICWLCLFLRTLTATPRLNYTIDCGSFNGGLSSGKNTCNEYGSSSEWDKIINRPLPSWYADMKLGIFIHWGVYSVPSFGNEWFWHNYACGNKQVKDFANKNFPNIGLDYPQYANLFHAELFDASEWVKILKAAGAQYVLPVAKHHDGFCMWNASETSPMWNAVQVGPKRDVLTELYDASVAGNLSFGIYYSQGEWFDSDFVADYRKDFNTTNFVQRKLIPQRLDLVTRYPKAILWHTDGGWMAPDRYWNNLEWLNYVYEKSPLASHVVTCNSMGIGCCQKLGTKCWEYGDAPSGGDRTTAGQVVNHFYTNQMTIQRGSWSWDRSENDIADFFTVSELLFELISTTAWNGTLIMNIGPTADGRIPPIFQERLASVGRWLSVNGEAIYGTRPWTHALPTGADPAAGGTSKNGTFYTSKGNIVYAMFLKYPKDGILTLSRPYGIKGQTKVELLTATGLVALEWSSESDFQNPCLMNVELPPAPLDSFSAWTLKLSGLSLESNDAVLV